MSSQSTDNKGKIWGLAAVAGVIAFLVLKLIVSYAFWPALLLAILIAILVAILLWIGFYRDETEDGIGQPNVTGGAALGAHGTISTTIAKGPEPKTESEPVAEVQEPAKKPAAKKPAAKTKSKTAAKTGTAKATTTRKTAAKPKTTTTRKKPAAKKPASGAKSTASSMMGDAGNAMAAEKKAASAKPSRAPVAKDGKPPLLKNARAGGADDLKVIKGVGPGLEKTLNELGFYHYDQVAGWRKKEIEWVDERLKFKGRIVRDDWVKQCKSLAKGAK